MFCFCSRKKYHVATLLQPQRHFSSLIPHCETLLAFWFRSDQRSKLTVLHLSNMEVPRCMNVEFFFMWVQTAGIFNGAATVTF